MRDPNGRVPIRDACLVQGHTLSVFIESCSKIVLYILHRTLSSRHLACANGQTVRSQNIEYYGTPQFHREKYVTSPTSRLDLEPFAQYNTSVWYITIYRTYVRRIEQNHVT